MLAPPRPSRDRHRSLSHSHPRHEFSITDDLTSHRDLLAPGSVPVLQENAGLWRRFHSVYSDYLVSAALPGWQRGKPPIATVLVELALCSQPLSKTQSSTSDTDCQGAKNGRHSRRQATSVSTTLAHDSHVSERVGCHGSLPRGFEESMFVLDFLLTRHA